MAKKKSDKNRKINTYLLVDRGNDEESPLITNKVEKKKRFKHRSESLGVVIIPECEKRSITLEKAFDMSPNGSICTSLSFLMNDDCYMSDITDDEEKRKRIRQYKRDRAMKVKIRPKSERNLGETHSKSARKKKSTKSRSLDPASRSLLDPGAKLEKKEDSQRSGNRSKRRGTRSTTKIEKHDSSNNPDLAESVMLMRRPRNSMEKRPKKKKDRMKKGIAAP